MIHHIGPRGSAMQLALLRSGGGLMLVGLLAWKTGWSVLKTSQLRFQLLRGFVSVIISLGADVLVCPHAVC